MSESESFPTPLEHSQYIPIPIPIPDAAPLDHAPSLPSPQHESQQTASNHIVDLDDTTSEGGDWFSIRDIVQEKIHNGKVYYLIDWEDDIRTGKSYERSWEPTENVTDIAKSAWLARQNQQSQLLSQQSSQQDSSVPAVNWRRLKRLGQRTHQKQLESSRDSPFATQGNLVPFDRRLQIIVAIPRDAAFDKAEYVFWPSSTDADADADADEHEHDHGPTLDNSGLCLLSDRPGEAQVNRKLDRIEIPDSQEISTGTESQSQVLRSATHSQLRSTVPDSQGYQETCIHKSETLRQASQRHDFFLQTEIPSHQPDGAEDRIASLISVAQSISVDSQPHQQLFPRSPSPGLFSQPRFLTQIPFQSQTSSTSSQVCVDSTQGREKLSSQLPSGEGALSQSVQHNSQAAQVVITGNHEFDDLQFQTQCDFDVYDDCESADEEFVPETIRRPLPAVQTPFCGQQEQETQESQESSQALSEVDGNNRNRASDKLHRKPIHAPKLAAKASFRPGSQANAEARQVHTEDLIWADFEAGTDRTRSSDGLGKVCVRPATPDEMESTSATSTPMSAKERLRMIRERHLGQTSDRNSAERSESLPTEHHVTAASLLEDQSALSVLQAVVTEDNDPAMIMSPSLALEPVSLPQKELVALPHFGELGQSSRMPQLDLDPVAAFIQDAIQISAEPTMSFEQPLAQRPIETHTIIEQPLRPVADIQNIALADLALVPDAAPIFLDPTKLTLSIEGDTEGSPSVATDDASAMALRHGAFGSPNGEQEVDADQSLELLPEIPTARHEYVVTLPFFSSTRPQYNDIIRDHEQFIQQYTACYSVTPHQQPSVGLIARIDSMFTRLFDICDYPPFLDTLPSMTPDEVTKHVVGTNPKICFIYELLLALREAEASKNVTILVRPGQIADLLTSVVQAGGHNLVGRAPWPEPVNESQSTVNVAILSTAEDVSAFSAEPDVYIVFDHAFDHELIASQGHNSSLILVLTLVASIQHLNMRVSEKMDSLERKNFLVLAIVKAMRYIEEPDFLPGIDKPHEIAAEFAQHLQNSEYDDFHYEGQHIPDDVFQDLHESSQVLQSQQNLVSGDNTPARQGLKRMMHDEDEFTSKRVRLSQPPLTGLMNHMSEPLRELLGDDRALDVSDNSKVISVSIDRLESLSDMIVQLQDELRQSRQREQDFRELNDRSKREVDGYVASIQSIQTKFMDAVRDRGTYEAECTKAQQDADKLRSSLEGSRQEASLLREKNHELARKLGDTSRALETGDNPELARISRLERDMSEAREAAEKADKKATLAEKNMEYSKDAYQEASRTVMELRSENGALTRRLDELAGRASENVVAVNRIQAAGEVKALMRLVEEQRSIVRDREFEISRIREELRLRNGRRETRQSSVPRSPARMSAGMGGVGVGAAGLMSPARGHSRTSGGGSGSGGGITGASSRGTSPVPMGMFDSSSSGGGGGGGGGPMFGQSAAASSRFAHLRE